MSPVIEVVTFTNQLIKFISALGCYLLSLFPLFFQSLLSFIFTWLQIHHRGKGIERSGKSFVMVGIPQKFHSQKWWWWLHTGLTKFKHFICVTIIITWIQNFSTKTSLPTQSYQACLHFHLKRYLCEGLRQICFCLRDTLTDVCQLTEHPVEQCITPQLRNELLPCQHASCMHKSFAFWYNK